MFLLLSIIVYKVAFKSYKVLKGIIENPYITQVKLSQIIGVSRRSIAKNISNLKDKQVIIRVGSDRKGYWKIL